MTLISSAAAAATAWLTPKPTGSPRAPTPPTIVPAPPVVRASSRLLAKKTDPDAATKTDPVPGAAARKPATRKRSHAAATAEDANDKDKDKQQPAKKKQKRVRAPVARTAALERPRRTTKVPVRYGEWGV
ncbi:hypothetical protein EDC01DRAFT_636726 [Geopyxis carbonaria]|nr:hypothetical protein EDC01DRAFT_636726 [Geopyxis carbonaria]